jgi:hypothetical protein
VIPVEEIRSFIIEGVSGHTGLTFKEQDEQGGEESAWLEFDYSSLMETRGHPVVEYGDGVMRETQNVEFTVTLYGYSSSKLERIIGTMKAREWLDRTGRYGLKDSFGCVLVSAGPVTNRDYRELGDGPWVRREGFDTRFRMMEIIETAVDTIDTVNIKGADHIVTN